MAFGNVKDFKDIFWFSLDFQLEDEIKTCFLVKHLWHEHKVESIYLTCQKTWVHVLGFDIFTEDNSVQSTKGNKIDTIAERNIDMPFDDCSHLFQWL